MGIDYRRLEASPTSSRLLGACKDLKELSAKGTSGWSFGLRSSCNGRHRIPRRSGRRGEVSRRSGSHGRDGNRVGMFLNLGERKPGETLSITMGKKSPPPDRTRSHRKHGRKDGAFPAEVRDRSGTGAESLRGRTHQEAAECLKGRPRQRPSWKGQEIDCARQDKNERVSRVLTVAERELKGEESPSGHRWGRAGKVDVMDRAKNWEGLARVVCTRVDDSKAKEKGRGRGEWRRDQIRWQVNCEETRLV